MRRAWIASLLLLALLSAATEGAAKPRHAKPKRALAKAALTPAPTALPTPTPLPEDRPGVEPADEAQRGAALQFDTALDRVLGSARFAWRSDRAAAQALGENLPLRILQDSLKAVGHYLERFFRALGRGLEGLGRWLRNLVRRVPWDTKSKQAPVSPPSDSNAELWWGLGLLTVAAVSLGLLIYRRARSLAPLAGAPAIAVAEPVDLRKPDLRGDELPEEGWLDLARRLAAEGQGRLALRAYYLAAINALGREGWLRLAASRSVGEYRRQLQRQGAAAELRTRFKGFSQRYEHAWFGTLGVGAADLAAAAAEQEAMRAHPR